MENIYLQMHKSIVFKHKKEKGGCDIKKYVFLAVLVSLFMVFSLSPAFAADPAPATCGNGSVDHNQEDCDDGNNDDGDCCNSNCKFESVGSTCADDELFCTGDETCDGAGVCTSEGDPCVGGGEACDEGSDTCIACTDDSECDDSNECTDDICNAGTCETTNNTDSCDDNDACTTGDQCSEGSCVGGNPPNCDDTNDCTDDSCDPASGCVNDNNTNSCSDGNDCTDGDVCSGGSCDPGPNPCSGGTPICTDEPTNGYSCAECVQDGECDDGIFCNGVESCSDGSCVAVSSCPPSINGCATIECDEDADECVDVEVSPPVCTEEGDVCNLDSGLCEAEE